MAQKFIISTDSSSDMFKSEMEKLNIDCIPLSYIVNNTSYFPIYDSSKEFYDFYKMLDEGGMPKTSMLNTTEQSEFFSRLLKQNPEKDLIHFSLSSGLSGTYSNACIAADEINAKSPNKVYVVDSLSATQGIRLLIDEAIKFCDLGKSSKATFEHIEKLKHNVHHWVIATNLTHLKRGGRLSATAAFLGSILNIRPIIVMNNFGKLAVVQKAFGAKKSIQMLVKAVEDHGVDIDSQTMYVGQSDNPEVADSVVAAIKEKFKCKFKIGHIGPVIGSHSGSGTLMIAFVGKERVKTDK